jgi:hypothetical protein
MPTYLIEREIPEAGNRSPEVLRGISQKSCGVLREMGPQIHWLESYVTGDKVYIRSMPGRPSLMPSMNRAICSQFSITSLLVCSRGIL